MTSILKIGAIIILVFAFVEAVIEVYTLGLNNVTDRTIIILTIWVATNIIIFSRGEYE